MPRTAPPWSKTSARELVVPWSRARTNAMGATDHAAPRRWRAALPSPPLVARPEDLLEGLNPEQAAAVSHGEGRLLVLAGAGSGTTRVLTRRPAWVRAQGGAPEGAGAGTAS